MYSTAYRAMRQFEICDDALERAMQRKREADAEVAAAAAEYSDAMAELVEELSSLYGDDMPEAWEMPSGVLVIENNNPRFFRTRSWADTYRIVDGEEAASCPT